MSTYKTGDRVEVNGVYYRYLYTYFECIMVCNDAEWGMVNNPIPKVFAEYQVHPAPPIGVFVKSQSDILMDLSKRGFRYSQGSWVLQGSVGWESWMFNTCGKLRNTAIMYDEEWLEKR